MCESREEEAAILAAEKRARGRLAIGFNRRFAPAIGKVREVLKQLPRPWIISYRLQEQSSYNKGQANSYYHNRAHIIYEGCHILDLAGFLLGRQPERVFMSGTTDENDIVTMEYPDGSRFVLVITSNAGGNGLEKELMEIFTPAGALSMRDFVELRIRGVEGEHDYLFEPQRCPFGKEVLRWGLDFWQKLCNRLVWEDIPISPGIVPLQLAAQEQPYADEVEKIAAEYEGRDWRERNFMGDKGWIGAFRHFAEACLNHTVPETADGTAGKMANELGFALLESKRKKIPVDFHPDETGKSCKTTQGGKEKLS
jgi:predicted dehydrogenase